jgi:hypothetical protein
MRKRIERHILRPGAVSCLGLLAACGGTGDTTTIGSASDTTSDVTGDTTSGTSTGEQGSDAGGEPDADTESEAFDDFVIDTPDGSGPVVVAALSESAADNSVALEQAFMAANNGVRSASRPGHTRLPTTSTCPRGTTSSSKATARGWC